MEVSIKSIALYVLKRWLIIIIALAVGATFGFVYTALKPEEEAFTSTSQLSIDIKWDDKWSGVDAVTEKRNIFNTARGILMTTDYIKPIFDSFNDENIKYSEHIFDKTSSKTNIYVNIENRDGYILTIVATTNTPEISIKIANALAAGAKAKLNETMPNAFNDIKVISNASTPTTASKASPVKNSIIFGLCGIALVVVVLVVIRLADRRLYENRELEQKYNINILGNVNLDN